MCSVCLSFEHVFMLYNCVEIGSICNDGHKIMTLVWLLHGYTLYACSAMNELNYRYEQGKRRKKSIKLSECFVVGRNSTAEHH